MQERLQALVLRTTPFSDTQQVADLYTRQHGRMSVVVPLSSRRHAGAAALWQPLSFVEMEISAGRHRNRLPHPHEARLYIIYTDLPFNPAKTAVALFLAEFLQNALRAELQEETLYRFLETSLQWLDTAREGYANFHLCFLLHLMPFVGIAPNLETAQDEAFFDLRAGTPSALLPTHPDFLMGEEARAVPRLLRINFANMRHFRLTRAQRQRALEVAILYYQLHLPPFPPLRSLEVLQAVFR